VAGLNSTRCGELAVHWGLTVVTWPTRWRLVSARDLTNVVTVTNQTNTHCKYYNFNLYYITRKVTKYSVLVASKWLRDLKGSIMNEFHM